MYISGSSDLIIVIWISLERSFPLIKREYKCPVLVKGNDVRCGTKPNACHGWLPLAQVSVG